MRMSDKPVQHVAENIIIQRLEHSRGVGKAKWHDQILGVTTGCVEGSFSLVPFLYAHQVVGVPGLKAEEMRGSG